MGGETGEVESGWTVDTLRLHAQAQVNDLRASTERQILDMRAMLNERYETQTRAVDAAFIAQSTAMATALTAAERAVATALLSAEKAVAKAEAAADKRFESVNEFRGQLADQAASMITRAEAESRFAAIIDKFDSEAARTAQRLNEINDRMNIAQGLVTGADKSITAQRLHVGQLVDVGCVVVAFLGVVAIVLIAVL